MVSVVELTPKSSRRCAERVVDQIESGRRKGTGLGQNQQELYLLSD